MGRHLSTAAGGGGLNSPTGHGFSFSFFIPGGQVVQSELYYSLLKLSPGPTTKTGLTDPWTSEHGLRGVVRHLLRKP